MVNTLSKARLNRTLYQYTKDPKFATQNVQALKELDALYKRLDGFKWDEMGQQKVALMGQLLNDYQNQRQTFVTAAQATSSAFDAIKPGALIALAHQFESLDMALTPDAALPVMHLPQRCLMRPMLKKRFSINRLRPAERRFLKNTPLSTL